MAASLSVVHPAGWGELLELTKRLAELGVLAFS
jgi:hypothetical protein